MKRGTAVLVIWLEAPESKYHGLEETWLLPKSPKAQRAERIICCTISRVSVFGFAKAVEARIGTIGEAACNVAELEAPVEVW